MFRCKSNIYWGREWSYSTVYNRWTLKNSSSVNLVHSFFHFLCVLLSNPVSFICPSVAYIYIRLDIFCSVCLSVRPSTCRSCLDNHFIFLSIYICICIYISVLSSLGFCCVSVSPCFSLSCELELKFSSYHVVILCDYLLRALWICCCCCWTLASEVKVKP